MAVNITYRLSDDTAPISTTVKGTPLTNAEIDGNFRSIKDAIEDFSESTGSALVGYDGGTVQDVLDSAKPMANYTALRAYTGRATSIRITTPGISGFFIRRGTTGLTDNGGTVVIDALGRAWERVFDGAIQADWFGISANGVTDDTARMLQIAAALKDGDTLDFPEKKTILMTERFRSNASFLTIRGNGSIIKFVAEGKQAFQLGGLDASYGTPYLGSTGSLAISIAKNSKSFACAGLTQAAPGKLAIVYNAITPRPEPIAGGGGTYFFGEIREIKSYTANILTVIGEFPQAFTATTVEVYHASRFSKIENLHVDLSGATNSFGIVVWGVHSEVNQCSAYGAGISDNNQMGIQVRGINCSVNNGNAKDLYHIGGGAVRTGYGIEVAGVDCSINNSRADNCKHCIATAERKFIDRGLVYRKTTTLQDAGLYGLTLADGVTPLISWPIDVHSNAQMVTIDNCTAVAPAYLIGVRNGLARIVNDTQISHNRESGDGLFGLYVGEMPIIRLDIVGSNLDVAIPIFWNATGTNKNIMIDDCDLQQGLRARSNVGNFENYLITRNRFKVKINDVHVIDLAEGSSSVKNLQVMQNEFDLSGVSLGRAATVGAAIVLDGAKFSGNTYKAGSNTRGIDCNAVSMPGLLEIDAEIFSETALMASDVRITGGGNYILKNNKFTSTVELRDMEYRRRHYGNKFATFRPKPFPESQLLLGDGFYYFSPPTSGATPTQGMFEAVEQVKLGLISLSTPIAYISRSNPAIEAAPYSSTWAATTVIARGVQVKVSSGAVYVAVVGGTTGATEPVIASRYGTTVDGTVTWKYLCVQALEPGIWSAVNHS